MTPPTDRAATVPTASGPWSQVPRAGLVDAVAAEWIRLRSVRAPWALLACVIGALPVLAAVVGATGSVMPDDTVLGASIVGGGTLAMLAAAGLGAVTVTAEHRSGGIAAAWAGTPRRGVLMAAQAIVVSVVCMAVALPAAGMACVVGSLTLDTAEFANLRPGEPWPALLGIALVVGCSGVIGVALGTILRHTGAALAAVGALVLLPGDAGTGARPAARPGRRTLADRDPCHDEPELGCRRRDSGILGGMAESVAPAHRLRGPARGRRAGRPPGPVTAMTRTRHVRIGRGDVALVAVLAVPLLMDAWWSEPGTRSADGLTFGLVAATLISLLVRRAWPISVALICGGSLTALTLVGHTGELLVLPALIALYEIAKQGGRRRTTVTAIVASAWLGVLGWLSLDPLGAPGGSSCCPWCRWPSATQPVPAGSWWSRPGGDRGAGARTDRRRTRADGPRGA